MLPLEIFSKPSCSFQTWTVLIFPPHRQFKGLIKGKVLPRCGRKRTPSDSVTFLSLLVFVCALLMCFVFKFWASLVFMLWLFHMFLFGYFSVLLCFVFHIKIKKKNWKKKSEKYKNSVCFVYIGTCVPWMAIKTKSSKLCIICSLDEHLYAQLSKWDIWLLLVMSKIKLSLVLNTHITLFDRKD